MILECVDTTNGATDQYDGVCSDYAMYGQSAGCGSFDDDDFKAKSMCCACGKPGNC